MKSSSRRAWLKATFGCVSVVLWAAWLAPAQVAADRVEVGSAPFRAFGKGDLRRPQHINNFDWDANGVLYGADRSGVVRFDGLRWRSLPGFDGHTLDIACVGSGRIYYSQFADVGYLEPGIDGVYRKVSFVERLKGEELPRFDSVLSDGETVWFVGSDRILAVDTRSELFSWILAPNYFCCRAALWSDGVYVGDPRAGLLHLPKGGRSFEVVDGSFQNESAVVVLAEGSGGRFAGVARDGRIFERSEGATKIAGVIESASRYGLRVFRALNDGGYVWGDLSGIERLGSDGKFRQRLDPVVADFRLPIRSLTLSPDGRDLWLASDGYVTRVDLESPVSRFARSDGIEGAIRRAARLDGDLYLATEVGLLKAQYDGEGRLANFRRLVDWENEQSGLLGVGSEGLFVERGHRLGVFDGSMLLEVEEAAEAAARTSYDGPYRLFTYGPQFVGVYERSEGVWTRVPRRIRTSGWVYGLHESSRGEVWVEMGEGTVGRLVGLGTREAVEIYGEEHGAPNEWIRVCEIFGEVVFVADSGFYKWSEEERRLLSYKRYDHVLNLVKRPDRIWEDQFKRIWVSGLDSIGVIKSSANGAWVLDTTMMEAFQDKPPKLVFMDSSGSWFASSSGLIHCAAEIPEGRNGPLKALISKVEVVGRGQTLADGLAYAIDPDVYQTIDYADGALRIELCVPGAEDAKGLEFQYRLSDSGEWSAWSASPEFLVAKLERRQYHFQARAHDLMGRVSPIVSYRFSVPTEFWDTNLGYLIYGLAGALVALAVFGLFLLALRRRNQSLELQVQDRTKHFEQQSKRLEATLLELQDAQGKLIDSARMSGKAEIATSVLHNVGNVLNSLSISVNSVSYKIGQSKVAGLGKVVDLFEKNKDDLVGFFGNHARTEKLVEYVKNLYSVLLAERDYSIEELEASKSHLAHAGNVIAQQQKHAKKVGVIDRFKLAELVTSACKISIPNRWIKSIELSIHVPPAIEMEMDHHVLLQMMTNFIKNAAESVMDAGISPARIGIGAVLLDGGERVSISVSDNGIGLDQEQLDSVFSMGFTTKSYGHGFGMHSVANEAKTQGGKVSIASEGIGKGATVTLELPLRPPVNEADLVPDV